MATLPQSELQSELQAFLNTVEAERLTVSFSEKDKAEALSTLRTFKGEAQFTLALIEKHLDANIRILEVGAGLCLLSLFLKRKGYNITALEPLAGGFGFFETLKEEILSDNATIHLETLGKPAQQLSYVDDGEFDLIFSNNVIEHIKELSTAVSSMRSVLSRGGMMVHGCPNYIVPYEPHFGLPVFSFWPQLTKLLWQTKIAENLEVWNSLNFITYFQIKKLANANNCDIAFQQKLTFDAFLRLKNDAEFMERHKTTIVGKVFRILEVTRTLSLTKHIPAWASTPMIFTMTCKNQGDL